MFCYVKGSDQLFTTPAFEEDDAFTADVKLYYCGELVYNVPAPVINSNNSISFELPKTLELNGRHYTYEVRTLSGSDYTMRFTGGLVCVEYIAGQNICASRRETLDFTFPTLDVDLTTYTGALLLGSGGTLPITLNADGTISLRVEEWDIVQTDYQIRLESASGDVSYPYGGLIWAS